MRLFRQLFFLLAAAPALAQPVINSFGVQNAASMRQGTPNLNLAPGAVVSISGQNLGPFASAQGDPNNPATTVGGVMVQINSGSYSNNAVIVSAAYNEVDLILPADVPTGPATVTVVYNSQNSNAANVNVAAASFSAFTMDTQDNAATVQQNFLNQTPITLNNLSGQAQTGQTLTLVGTGLGGMSNVSVMVGNTPAQVISAGPENCCAGFDSIVFTVPPGADGCVIGVQVGTGQVSNVVAPISVTSDGRFCPDQSGFSPQDIALAQSKGSLNLGYLFLLRFTAAAPSVPTGPFGPTGGGTPEVDIGLAEFSNVTYDEITSYRGLINQSVPGACWGGNTNGQVYNQVGTPGLSFFADFYPFGNTPLDAGSNVHLSGSGNSQTMMPAGPGAYYGTFFNLQNPLSSYLQPGSYTFDDGSGGGGVPAFTATVNVNPPITFSGTSAITAIDRTKDLTINYTGGGTDDRVLAIIYAGTNSFNTDGSPVAGIAACTQLASNKQVTIPSAYLATLPATGSNPLQGQGLILLYSEQLPARSQPSSGGLDAVYMMTLGYTAQLVQVQ